MYQIQYLNTELACTDTDICAREFVIFQKRYSHTKCIFEKESSVSLHGTRRFSYADVERSAKRLSGDFKSEVSVSGGIDWGKRKLWNSDFPREFEIGFC